MIHLFWNCRGLGQPRTVQELTRLVREFCPNILFLSEKRQDKKTVEFVCRRLGFPNCFPVTVIGKGSGLVLCWKNDVSVDLVSFSHHHIDVILQHPNGIKERNTFVYGEPCTHIRHEFWSLLRRIKHGRAANLPWVMLGDFNETL